MSKEFVNTGKSLSGISNVSGSILGGLTDSVASQINSGSVVFNNMVITSGIIDGTVIGSNQPGPINATTIVSGNPNGVGYEVCFYGDIVGDEMCWEPAIGRLEISGDLLVRDISDFGNLRLSGNFLNSTNTNGSIFVSPNGTGNFVVNGGGNIELAIPDGVFDLGANSVDILSNTSASIKTNDGNIVLETGLDIPNKIITFISSGLNPLITTSTPHLLNIGDIITITGSTSIPSIDGDYTVTNTTSTTTFNIGTLNTPVITPGISGTITNHNNINITSNNINLTASDIIRLDASDSVLIPVDTKLTFGNNTDFYYDGTDTILDSKSSDLLIKANTTFIESSITAVSEPVMILGGISDTLTPDILDRGIMSYYNNGTPKISYFGRNSASGCFTYIPDATNTGNIFTGTPGCATFGNISITGLNLNGGTITNSGAISVSTINACNITCSGTMVLTGGIAINLVTPTVNITGDLVTNDIESSGTADFNDVNVTGNITGIGFDTEHISVVSGGVANPSASKNTTFITVLTTGSPATGTLQAGTKDGMHKHIIATSLPVSTSYRLFCPNGMLLDPGSGTTNSKTLLFETAGQSVHLIWNNITDCYVFANAGVCIE